MAKARLPVVPAMPPIEKSTSAGTPLATQKAPRQSMVLCNWPLAGTAVFVVIEFMTMSPLKALLSAPAHWLSPEAGLSRSRPEMKAIFRSVFFFSCQ